MLPIIGIIVAQDGITTKIAPQNGWLKKLKDTFLVGWLPGRCELLVSGSLVKRFFGGGRNFS